MATGWYVRRGEKVIGPIEVNKLKEFVVDGKLLPTDKLSRDAAGPWTTAGRTKLFAKTEMPLTPPQSFASKTEIVAKPPVVVDLEPPKPNPVIKAASSVGHGVLAAGNAISRSFATRAQRRHEIRLAKIHAQAVAAAIQPAASRPTAANSGATLGGPQIVHTTVKVVNKNGGCGCSGCGTLLLAMVGVLVLASIFGPDRSSNSGNGSSSSFSSTPPTSSRKIEAWVMAQQFVENRLKSPSSASFGGLFSEYQDPDDVVTDLGGGKFRVVAWVDSQNSFGAQIRTHFVCELQDMGNEQWSCTEFVTNE